MGTTILASARAGWNEATFRRSVSTVEVCSSIDGRPMFGQFYAHNESWIGIGGYYTLPGFDLRRVGTARQVFDGGRCPPYEDNFWEAHHSF